MNLGLAKYEARVFRCLSFYSFVPHSGDVIIFLPFSLVDTDVLSFHRLGPLTPVPKSDGMLMYNFELMVMEGESLVLEPTAAVLLFSPPRGLLVGANDCVSTAVELYAEKGQLVEGQVIPPSAGIKVTVTKGSSDEVVVVTETAEDGKFKIGPLQGGVDYR